MLLLEEETVPVAGFLMSSPNASEVFYKLKKMGASWESYSKIWHVPKQMLPAALALSPILKPIESKKEPAEPPQKPAEPEPKPTEPAKAEVPPQEVAADDIKVAGPGIEFLKNTWDLMGLRGAPTEINNYGFGKGHYDIYSSMSAHPDFQEDELPLKMIKRMMDILGHYRKTQLSEHWDKLVQMVRADIKAAQEKVGIQQPDHGAKIHVYNAEPKRFNRIKVHIPSLDLSKTRKINKIMDDHFIAKKMPMDMDNYGAQNYSKKRWQYFQKDSVQLDIYWIHPAVIKNILDYLKAEGYEITYQDDTDLSEKPGVKPKLKVLGQEDTQYGRKLVVTYDLDFVDNVNLRKELTAANLWPKGIVWMGKTNGVPKYGLALQAATIDKVADVLRKHVDISELTQELQKMRGLPMQDTKGMTLNLADRGGNKMSVKIPSNIEGDRKMGIKQIINYTFPESAYNWNNFSWEVVGDFQQYHMFRKLLERYKWITNPPLEQIIENKVIHGGLNEESLEGEIPETFEPKIDAELPESDFDLNQLQKEGIAFLHHRRSAVLGDETGFGKCFSLSTNIYTNHGCMPAEVIWNNFSENIAKDDVGEWASPKKEMFVHSIDENGKVVKGKVAALYREKVKTKLKKVKTSNGKEITVTIPHKFLTPTGWKADINVGDYVCSSSNQFSLGTNDFNDVKLAELLGWTIGEGNELATNNTVRITQSDVSVLERLKETYDSYGFSKSNISKHSSGRASCLIFTSKTYRKFLEGMGYIWNLKSAQKQIPEFIMQANNEVVKVFLRAIFDAEAYVNPRARQIEFISASKKLVYQVGLLLQRFNLNCTFAETMKRATNSKMEKRKYYRLYITGSSIGKYMEQIGFTYQYKIDAFNNIKTKINSNKEGKPAHLVLQSFFEKYDIPYRLLDIPAKNYISGKRWATNDMMEQMVQGFEDLKSGKVRVKYKALGRSKWTDKTLAILEKVELTDINVVIDGLNQLRNNDLQYERVISVEEVDYDDYVYDLSVKKYHNYIAENLICHNTVQLISAAEMKMKESGYKGDTLIFVPKQGGTTLRQWEETILRVIGEKNKHLISFNPLQPRRWTILWYQMFSVSQKMKAKADAMIDSIKNHNFLIVILDELHSIKKEDATKSVNILRAIENIPIRWGASATISSNKPYDVKNQLAMIGHPLGRVAKGKFKKDFAGQVPKGYGGAYVDGDIEDQIRAAEHLNKWLHLTGVYVRRSKEDVRDMPGLSVTQENAPFDYKGYESRMTDHVNRLKKPDLVISILNAAREELAVAKVPSTVQKVLEIVKQGHKVVVFTAFLQAGHLLKEYLRNGVKKINPNWDILTYTSDTHKNERAMAKSRFTNDPRYRVILMSIKMGGTGIDFPNAAQNMVINDYDWTPEQAEQSEGRIYRINTEKPVKIEYMIANGTIDEALFSKVQQKRELASIIQRYRKDYQEDKEPEKALDKIVMYRKQLEALDEEIRELRKEAARMFNPKAHESVEIDDIPFDE